MKKCSTLFFQPNDNYSGSVRVLASVIEEDYANQIVYIITSSGRKGFLAEMPNVRMIYYWNPRWSNKILSKFNSIIWRFSACLVTFFVGLRFDTFYINTIVPSYAAKIGTLLNKKIIYHVHEKFVTYSKGNKIAEDTFNNTVSHRIFVSNYLKNQYPEHPLSTFEIKYNKLAKSFTDKIIFRPLDERKRNTVIMISSLLKEKGAYSIIELAKMMPEYQFLYIMNATSEHIADFYKEIQVPNNISLIHKQNDIHPFLQKADINLNLSDPEGWVETFGMTILEAMAYGIPSIAPSAGGPLEIVEDGKNGYCLDVTNLQLVSEKIRYVLDADNYGRFVDESIDKYNSLLKNY